MLSELVRYTRLNWNQSTCSLRKIFINERRSQDAAPGPTNAQVAQAAQIMGDSVEA